MHLEKGIRYTRKIETPTKLSPTFFTNPKPPLNNHKSRISIRDSSRTFKHCCYQNPPTTSALEGGAYLLFVEDE